jgi:methylmalonyl-CoA decarboxylase
MPMKIDREARIRTKMNGRAHGNVPHTQGREMMSKMRKSAEGGLVLYEEKGAVGIITINNPSKANCLSSRVVAGILDFFDEVEARSIRVAILRAYPGAGVWSAGHDIKEIPCDGSDPLPWDTHFERLLRRVRALSVPVMGMIEGSVWGGGCDLAMSCDLLVGTDTATFAITPAKIGLAYNSAGMTHFLGVLPLHVIKEMFFTGKPITAERAYSLGVLNRLVPRKRFEEEALALAGEIADRAPLVVSLFKKELNQLSVGPALSADEFEEIQTLRSRAYQSRDMKEGLRAFFEKRKPDFKGR